MGQRDQALCSIGTSGQIATQLERIEQDVKQRWRVKHGLNALVDGLRGDIDKRAHVFRGMEAGITKLSNELPPAFLGLYDRLTLSKQSWTKLRNVRLGK